MTFSELPDDRPIITGLKSKYKIEDIVALNCTSRNSKPSANLTWYINNKPVSAIFIQKPSFSLGMKGLSTKILSTLSLAIFKI